MAVPGLRGPTRAFIGSMSLSVEVKDFKLQVLHPIPWAPSIELIPSLGP